MPAPPFLLAQRNLSYHCDCKTSLIIVAYVAGICAAGTAVVFIANFLVDNFDFGKTIY